jgi:hypothetical protein
MSVSGDAMPDPQPRRPCWRKNRYRLTAALWLTLPILYPLSVGPANYIRARDWLPAPCHPALDAFHRPLLWATKDHPDVQSALVAYGDWWYERGVADRLDDRARQQQHEDPSAPVEP